MCFASMKGGSATTSNYMNMTKSFIRLFSKKVSDFNNFCLAVDTSHFEGIVGLRNVPLLNYSSFSRDKWAVSLSKSILLVNAVR